MTPPPHEVLHGDQSPTTQAKVSHGHPLHASSPAGCGTAEHALSPPGALAPLTRHDMERLRTPPPHGAEHIDHGPALQCAMLQLLVQTSTAAGRAAAAQSAEPTIELPSATQTTERERYPGPQAALQAPQSPTIAQVCSGHGTLLHACSKAGAVPRPAAVHASGGDTAPVLSRHVTVRVCVPPPHAAEQEVHSPVAHPKSLHGRSQHAASDGGGGPSASQVATDRWTGGWTGPVAVQSTTGLKLPWRYGGRKGSFLSCLVAGCK
jgi:hypothetical protein